LAKQIENGMTSKAALLNQQKEFRDKKDSQAQQERDMEEKN
jgi:hypothetical protein